MADFILHTIVEDIYARYEALPGGREPLSRDEHGRPQFGNLEKAKHAAIGKTVWMLQGGNFGAPVLAGGPDGPTHDALTRFLVWMWVPDLQAGWNLMVDLIAAIRQTAYGGASLGLLNFTVPTELEGREMHAGELYVLDLTLAIPIPGVGSVPLTEVELQSHESTVTQDSGIRVDGDGNPDEDGDFEAFETVVVTGPPTP